MPSSRPRIPSKLFKKLKKRNIDLNELISREIDSGTNTVPFVFKRKLVPAHAVLDPAVVAGLNQEVTQQSIDTSLNNIETDINNIDTSLNNIETDVNSLDGKDFATQTTLSAINTKIDEELDDDTIPGNATNPVLIAKLYYWDGSNWKRYVKPTASTPQVVDVALGGSAVAASALGGLGNGILAGIGSAAGNLLAIGSQGNLQVTLNDGSGNNPYLANIGDNAGAMYSLAVSAIQLEINNNGNHDRIRHSFYQQITGINSAPYTGAALDISTTPMSKFMLVGKGIPNTGTFTSANINLQFSLDNTNWFTDPSGRSVSLGAGASVVGNSIVDQPAKYVRIYVSALVVVGDATLTVQLLASAR